jgi:hypothetical protein
VDSVSRGVGGSWYKLLGVKLTARPHVNGLSHENHTNKRGQLTFKAVLPHARCLTGTSGATCEMRDKESANDFLFILFCHWQGKLFHLNDADCGLSELRKDFTSWPAGHVAKLAHVTRQWISSLPCGLHHLASYSLLS